MPKLLVLYDNSYAHIEAIAGAIAEGAREVPYTAVTIKRVPEVASEEMARKSNYKLDLRKFATVDELPEYDAIIFGTLPGSGNMCAQIGNFLEQTSGLWMKGALVGKVGSVFASTASRHGGQETTAISIHATLLHHGMIIVGLPCGAQGPVNIDAITGRNALSRRNAGKDCRLDNNTVNEMKTAHFQGRHVAGITAKLAAAPESRPVMLW